MTPDDSVDPLRFDRDLPTTAEDVAVPRRLRYGPTLTFDEYLQFLATLEPPSPEQLRSRPGPGGPPFDLIG